eukprot:10814021-Alexandrium_andersonii.AAC.1
MALTTGLIHRLPALLQLSLDAGKQFEGRCCVGFCPDGLCELGRERAGVWVATNARKGLLEERLHVGRDVGRWRRECGV